jgi:hypothetical protein
MPSLFDLCKNRRFFRSEAARLEYLRRIPFPWPSHDQLTAFSRLDDLDGRRSIVAAAAEIIGAFEGRSNAAPLLACLIKAEWRPVSCCALSAMRLAIGRFDSDLAKFARHDGIFRHGPFPVLADLRPADIGALMDVLWSHEIDGAMSIAISGDDRDDQPFSIQDFRRIVETP